jgi:WXXGXW repeat (2 copies)
MRRRAIIPFLCAAAPTLAAAPGVAGIGVVVGVAPPAPVVEPVPSPPDPGYVWQPGYWSWNGVQYVWVPGAYVAAPTSTRYGSPEPWSGMAPAGCGSVGTGGTGGCEAGWSHASDAAGHEEPPRAI